MRGNDKLGGSALVKVAVAGRGRVEVNHLDESGFDFGWGSGVWGEYKLGKTMTLVCGEGREPGR